MNEISIIAGATFSLLYNFMSTIILSGIVVVWVMLEMSSSRHNPFDKLALDAWRMISISSISMWMLYRVIIYWFTNCTCN